MAQSKPKHKVPAMAARKTARRVRVASPAMPPTRSRPADAPLMIPSRWLKFVIALFLLPTCAVLTQTFFTSFARAAVTQRLWAGEEFWFFSLGALLWLIAFFGLPKPVLVYVFGHELTHALWVWIMGGRVSKFRVSREGGHIITDRNNFWIALAPYFFPIYSILAIGLYGLTSLFLNVQPYGRLLYAAIGVTWAFHLTFSVWMIGKNQSDLRDQGTFFSLVVIYLMNLLLLCVMLVLAASQITLGEFGRDLLTNVANFANGLDSLAERLARGARH
jgi:hypothetical protein